MEKYDYLEAVVKDVETYVNNMPVAETIENVESLSEFLFDKLINYDGVTGNASGSYTFNAYQAEENIAHNLDLLELAMDEFGYDYGDLIRFGAEWADVVIRCYLLPEAIGIVLDDMEIE